MLAIQEILRTVPNGIDYLKEHFAISAKRHNKYPNLISFKYSQIDSPFKEQVVQEARGIILDEADNWNVVAMGFKKFFNQGEPLAASIDWLSATVQEKVDGSLMMLYSYKGEWQVASSGTPDASGEVNLAGMTFADLFWKTLKEQGVEIQYFHRNCTWVMELTTPYNRVVVDHKDCKLWLLGIVSNDLKEDPPHIVSLIGEELGFYVPEQYPLYNLDDCLKAANALVPTDHEGFVVVDKNFNRVKIKSPAYVMLHHAKDSLSVKRMCDVVRKGEYAEFATAIETLPELKKIFDKVSYQYCLVRDLATHWYENLRHIESQKEFAIQAKKTEVASVLFQMRKTGQTAAECLASPKMTLDHFMSLIGQCKVDETQPVQTWIGDMVISPSATAFPFYGPQI